MAHTQQNRPPLNPDPAHILRPGAATRRSSVCRQVPPHQPQQRGVWISGPRAKEWGQSMKSSHHLMQVPRRDGALPHVSDPATALKARAPTLKPLSHLDQERTIAARRCSNAARPGQRLLRLVCVLLAGTIALDRRQHSTTPPTAICDRIRVLRTHSLHRQ
jgi:hypothetical protein